MCKIAVLNQCVAYFKQNNGFDRIFEKMREKYRSLGYLGGTVTLDNLKLNEKEALTGFLKKDYTKKKNITIKVEVFENALRDTKFEELSLIDILEKYFDESLISKKEEKSLYEVEKEKFFMQFILENEENIFTKWIKKAMDTKEFGYKTLSSRYDTDKNELKEDLYRISKALELLPFIKNNKQRLAIFASNVTKNPHSFDEGTNYHNLLIYVMMFLFDQPYPKSAEERAEIFYRAGIIKDDISNYTNCYGLLALSDENIHPGWEGFYRSKEPMQITLWNLAHTNRVESPCKKVYVVENPTVFSSIIDGLKDLNIALICTNGQVRLASLILLDKLIESGAVIYYSGDFDPEGLNIADKLKERYKENLVLWHYTKIDYNKALSDVAISQSRIKKLEKLKDPSLKEIAKDMEDLKLAGYQELLIEYLKKDISEREGRN